MYTLVSAIGVPVGLNKRWQTIDLTTITVANLFRTYRKAQVTLTPPGVSTHVFLDIANIASTYATYTGTFSALLTSLGNVALPTTTTGFVLNERSATFSDAFKAGYNVTPVDTDNAISLNLPNSQLPNLRLSRQDIRIDYNYFQANCLVNVNGYYHRTSTDFNELPKSEPRKFATYRQTVDAQCNPHRPRNGFGSRNPSGTAGTRPWTRGCRCRAYPSGSVR